MSEDAKEVDDYKNDVEDISKLIMLSWRMMDNDTDDGGR